MTAGKEMIEAGIKTKIFWLIILLFVLAVAIIGYLFFCQPSSQTSSPASIQPSKTNQDEKFNEEKIMKITTIFDNYYAENQTLENLSTGWGFSALLEIADRKILFDTGADGNILLANMATLEIKPAEIETVVLSHNHDDHTGGLADLLAQNSNLKVYLPKSFPQSFKNEIISEGGQVVEVDQNLRITENVYSTGQLGTSIKEQALLVKTSRGLIVITGCAHPELVEIVKESKKITGQEIYLIMGGFHLLEKSEAEIESVIKELKNLGVKKVAPSHCSGEKAKDLFKKEYQDDFINNGVGKIIEIS